MNNISFTEKMRLKSPDTRIDGAPSLSILLLCLFFMVFTSRFIMTQGALMELPSSAYSDTCETSETIILRSNNLVIFHGELFTFKDFRNYFLQNKAKSPHTTLLKNRTVLLKLDHSISLDALFQLTDLLRSTGYSHIQIATLIKDHP